MTIAVYSTDFEFIKIERANNRKYFIDYGFEYSPTLNRWYANCSAGPFESFTDAAETLKKHRPTAMQIKDFCGTCKARQMYGCKCNGCDHKTPYTNCVCRR